MDSNEKLANQAMDAIANGDGTRESQVAEIERVIDLGISQEWQEIRRWKPFLHWCFAWDLLLVDRGDPEFESCTCFTRDKSGNPIPFHMEPQVVEESSDDKQVE
jgi:hypothetical protein